MGFLDSLGNTVKKLGKAAIAGPGAVWDIASYVTPGDQWGSADDSTGSLLDSLGHRTADISLAVPAPIKTAVGGVMTGLNTVYHEAIDQPLSTLSIEMQHASEQGTLGERLGSVFSADDWSQAYKLAEHQSFGQSSVYGLANSSDAADPFKPGNTFDQTVGKSHPFLANASAFGIDVGVSWFLDPAVVAGKVAGEYRQAQVLGKIPEPLKGHFGALLDSSIQGDKSFRAQDWAGRFDEFFRFINGENKLGVPLNAAQIRASSVELQKSSGGLAISSALEDALKLPDAADRANAARRVFAVAAGDTTQIARLKAEIPGTSALADKLQTIVSQKNLDLQAQALNTALKDSPEFRLAFNRRLDNLDERGDLSAHIGEWYDQTLAQKTSLEKLIGAGDSDTGVQHTLAYMPTRHGGPLGSNHKLAVGERTDALSKLDNAHDSVVEKLFRLPKRDSFSTVYQQGLYSLPVMAVYPARFVAATLPTKAIPKVVNGLRTVQFNGVINLHDWDAASEQLNSMMIHAGVDNETRLKQLSEAYGARTEVDKMAVAHRTEQVAVDGIVRNVAAKHGLDEAKVRQYTQQMIVHGQQGRGGMLAAQSGGRTTTTMYSASEMPPVEAARLRSMANARTQAAWDNRRAAEMEKRGIDIGEVAPNLLPEGWKPTVDQFIDSSGVPYTMPLETSQLANRIPLLDVRAIRQMANDQGWIERLQRHADAWHGLAEEATGLQASLARATGSRYDSLQRRLMNVRRSQDVMLSAASAFNRWWKVGVLFRLGYPMRVVADDHMRIAARIGYLPFLMANVPEGARNTYYNYGSGLFPGTRRAESRALYEAARSRRADIRAHLGRDKAHTDAEWTELQGLVREHLAGTETPEQAARRLALDPQGKVTEWADLQKQVSKLGRSRSADAQGALAQVQEQLAGKVDPALLRNELASLDEQIRGTLDARGAKAFRAPKRHIGQADVDLGDGVAVQGAFPTPAEGYFEAVKSNNSFDYILTEGEQMGFRLHSSGHWRSVRPDEPGYYQLWANILNHQFQHGPGFMAIVRGEVKSPQEFAAWLSKPEQANLRTRVAHFAADPKDWGGRLMTMVDDYVPTQELADAMVKGRVSARQLETMFGKNDPRRPLVHGQLADVNSGRAGMWASFNDGIQRAFSYLAEVPTDRLSRHPYFNAVYKAEARRIKDGMVAERGKDAVFSDEDLRLIERVSRQKALSELKQTLWDVSAHSHMAHTLRFLSPFFAAHQEALNRWWNIAKDDPSVARRFQLAFDAPRKAGLVYNADTGEVVKPGEAIGGPGNKIMMKLPFADDKNAVNKWLKKMGGGAYWQVNESGFNLILQNGIVNPGVGPLVTIPMESLVEKYPEAVEFEKAARSLNQYPPLGGGTFLPGVPIDPTLAVNATAPSWAKRAWALYRGEKSHEFSNVFAGNIADELTAFRLANDNRPPTAAEFNKILDRANKATHRDLVIELASNAGFFTPAKPNSRYSVQQNILTRLYEQMRAEGHDMEWLRDSFRAQVGDEYMALIYSMGSNPSRLDGTPAEASAVKRHSKLVGSVDPSLVRMIVGPEADSADDKLKMYSPSVTSWLETQNSGIPGETLRGSKNPREAGLDMVIQQGWDMYDEMTNALDVMAEQQGLPGYEASPQLMEAKRRGLEYIKAQNPVFAHSYDSPKGKSFDGLVDQMRMIVADKRLASDPTRSDIYWLGQYIQMRDAIKEMLAQRAQAGGDKTIGAQSNADLARAFAAGLQYINQQSPYFKQFNYPILEKDPYLV